MCTHWVRVQLVYEQQLGSAVTVLIFSSLWALPLALQGAELHSV
jgi:hypothetical protein